MPDFTETRMRESFEAWARGPAGYVDDQLARYADGSYQDSITLSHWSIWRAAWRANTEVIPDPRCKSCGGEGIVCVGHSGREDDGNAPITEPCDCFATREEHLLFEVADLRNVVQAACTSGGLAAMAAAWQKYFPDQPITVVGLQAADGVGAPLGEPK